MELRVYFSLLFLSLLFNISQAQTEVADTILLENAYIHLDNGKLDSANFYFSECVNSSKASWEVSTEARLGLVFTHFITEKHNKALKFLEPLLNDPKVSKAEDKDIYYDVLNFAGTLYQEKKDPEKALFFFHKKLDLLDEDSESEDFGSLYNNLGSVYNSLNDYDHAIEYFNQAIDIYSKNDNYKACIPTLVNIGFCLSRKNELTEALKQLVLAENFIAKGQSIPYGHLINIYNQKASIYSKQDSTLLAINELNKAMKLQSTKALQVEFTKGNLGFALLKQKQFSKAEPILKETIKLMESKYGKNHSYTAKMFLYLGQALHGLNKPNAAINIYNEGIKRTARETVDQAGNIVFKDISSKRNLIRLLDAKATLLSQIDKKKEALVIYNATVTLIDQARLGFLAEGSKKFLLDFAFPIYERAIGVSLELYESGLDLKYASQFLFFIEKSKAVLMLDALQDTKAKRFGNIPDSLTQAEQKLASEIEYYEINLLKAQQKNKLEDAKLFQVYLLDKKEQYSQLIEQFEKNYPKYFQIKYDFPIADLENIQEQLTDEKRIIEYFEGDNYYFGIEIQKSGIKLFKIERTARLNYQLRRYRQLVSNYKLFLDSSQIVLKDFKFLSKQLFTSLIPSDNSKKEAIIIPDGYLNLIPFETFLTADVASESFLDFEYWLKSEAISYSYSASMWLKNGTDQSKGKAKLLGFAPSYDENNLNALQKRDGRKALPGALEEVEAISKLFNGVYHLKDQAKEKTFKDLANHYGLLHLAMHSEMDDEFPAYSRLVFYQDSTDQEEDNFLYNYELQKLDLNADLVVLSACETGLGKYVRGEGVMSLARGFMSAGCPSILMSLWKVGDQSSSKIMIDFYKKLSDKQQKNKALQLSKLDYLNSADNLTAHPVFWSGFVAIGNMDAIAIAQNSGNYWLFGISCLLVAFAFGVLILRRAR